MRRQVMLTAQALGLATLLTACGLGGTDEPGPLVEPSRSASASATSPGGATPPGDVVSVERVWRETRVRLDVHPVEVDGELAVLRYEFAGASAGGTQSPFLLPGLALALGGLGTSVTDGRGVRLFDTSAGLVHLVAQAPGGSPAAAIEQVGDGTGDQRRQSSAVVAFAAPVNESVDVLFPGLGFVTVPVVPAGDDFAGTIDELGGVGRAETRELRAFTRGYDAESATSAEDDAVTVTLSSDVLFARDQHVLSTRARAVVDRAAASIREQADGGDVHVVGHTDDVGTETYNQALSERRARTVADRLRSALSGDFTVTEEGQGESQPIAEGTSDRARAANRRVEIEFQGHLVVETEEQDGAPPTDAPTADNGRVTVTTDDGEYTVEVESVVRRPGAIVGTLVAERTVGTSIDAAWFLPSYLEQIGDRRFGVLADLAGPHNLSLLGSRERVLPFDYVQEERPGGFVLRRLLGDEELEPIDRGDSILITVVWPDTGQETVTIDAPDRFRITDVPVTDTPSGE